MSVHDKMNLTKQNVPTGYPTRKKKWEDDYKRGTYYIDKDLFDELEIIVNKDKGGKTTIINEALKDWISLYKAGQRKYPK